MGFITDFGSPEFAVPKVYLHLYGSPKVGKTRTVLKLVEDHRDFMVMISTDNGLFWVRQEPHLFEKRLAVASPTNLKELRADLESGVMRVKQLLRKKVNPSRIWFVIDNLTHLQQRLLVEARKVKLKGAGAEIADEMIREVATEFDWNVNLGHMSEVASVLETVPCNVITIALEKEERDERRATGKIISAISGQSYNRFVGDADAVLHLDVDEKDNRFLSVHGDRSNKLPSKLAETDLKLIQADMMPAPPAPQALEKPKEEGSTNEDPGKEKEA